VVVLEVVGLMVAMVMMMAMLMVMVMVIVLVAAGAALLFTVSSALPLRLDVRLSRRKKGRSPR